MSDLFKLVDYHFPVFFDDGGKHLWRCFGERSRWLDLRTDIDTGCICCIYDETDINRIYYVGVCDYRRSAKNRAVRWVHPDYMPRLKAEAKARKLPCNIAYDDVKYKEVAPSTLLKAAKDLIASQLATMVPGQFKQLVVRK